MSLVEKVYVRCDVCGRTVPFFDDRGLESQGWRRVDFKDVCPDHRGTGPPPRSGPETPSHVL